MLEDRPEALDGIRVDRANNILAVAVLDDGVRVPFVEVAVASPLIGNEQADLVGDGFADEASEDFGVDSLDDAGPSIERTDPFRSVIPIDPDQ